MNNQKSFRVKILIIFLVFMILYTSSLCCLIFVANKGLNYKTASYSEVHSQSLPTVIIDAGHGGEDGGAIGVNGSYEKDINLSISKKLNSLLNACGIKTVMTRTEDILLYDKNSDYEGRKKALDQAARLKISESYENAIFVSIHMNSFPQNKYKGLQVYYSSNDRNSSNLAEEIQALTKTYIMNENQRKIKASDGKIFLLDKMNIPSVLIECGFLSNPEECLKLNDENYQNELASVICCAICKYLS